MSWTHRDEIQATTAERLDHWGAAIYRALGGKVSGKPLQITRPEQKTNQPEKQSASPQEVAAFFARVK